MAAHLAQDTHFLINQRDAPRQCGQSARGPGQRLLLIALLQVQVDDVEIILLVVGNRFQQLLENRNGLLAFAAALLPLVVQFHRVDQVLVQHRVLRINLVDAFQQAVGLDVVALLAVEVDLTPPQPAPVGLDLQQFVDETDGAGVVLRDVLDIDQQFLGIDVVVIDVHGLEQVVARLVVVLLVEPVAARQVLEVGGERIFLQRLVEQHLALFPLLGGEMSPHLLGILLRRHDLRRDAQGCQRQQKDADRK